MKRVKVLSKGTRNPLFEKWLLEWKKEADEKKLASAMTLGKAIRSIKKYPFTLLSGQECIILEHFGKTICDRLDKKLAEYRKTLTNEEWEGLIISRVTATAVYPPSTSSSISLAIASSCPSSSTVTLPAKPKRTHSNTGIASSTPTKPKKKRTLVPSSTCPLPPFTNSSAISYYDIPCSSAYSERKDPAPSIAYAPVAAERKGKRRSDHLSPVKLSGTFVPGYRSGAYALLLTLLAYQNKGPMTQSALEEEARWLCDETAWDDMVSLITRDLVIVKHGSVTRYKLTQSGRHLASKVSQLSREDFDIFLASTPSPESSPRGGSGFNGIPWELHGVDPMSSPYRNVPYSPVQRRDLTPKDRSKDIPTHSEEVIDISDSSNEESHFAIRAPQPPSPVVIQEAMDDLGRKNNFLRNLDFDNIGAGSVFVRDLNSGNHTNSVSSQIGHSKTSVAPTQQPATASIPNYLSQNNVVGSTSAPLATFTSTQPSSSSSYQGRLGVDVSNSSPDVNPSVIGAPLSTPSSYTELYSNPRFSQQSLNDLDIDLICASQPRSIFQLDLNSDDLFSRNRPKNIVASSQPPASSSSSQASSVHRVPPDKAAGITNLNSVRLKTHGPIAKKANSKLSASSAISGSENTPSDSQASSEYSLEPHETVFLFPGQFKIILLVDNNETLKVNKTRYDAALQQLQGLGVASETRHLTVGDFLWVARDNAGTELVLPYVVERKRMDDLAASIKDSRYYEQKFRLKRCGLPNIIYLVERHGKQTDRLGLPVQTLRQAMSNTLVVEGFKLQTSNSHEDSMQYLACVTQLLTRLYKDKTLMSCPKKNLPNASTPPDPLCKDLVPLMAFKQFNKDSTKTKNLTIKEMLIKQLLQLHGMSVAKAVAIADRFPTPAALVQDLEERGWKILADLRCGNQQRAIGPAMAKTVHMLYTQLQLE